MDDDLRTEIVEFLDPTINNENKFDTEILVERLEQYLNKKGYAFYDERGPKPIKL